MSPLLEPLVSSEPDEGGSRRVLMPQEPLVSDIWRGFGRAFRVADHCCSLDCPRSEGSLRECREPNGVATRHGPDPRLDLAFEAAHPPAIANSLTDHLDLDRHF